MSKAKAKTQLKKAATAPTEKLKAEVKQLQTIIDTQAERIDQLQAARNRGELSAATVKPKRGAFFRVIVSDTHGSYLCKKSAAAFLSDLAALGNEVKEIVFTGDHLECGGFLSAHHTLSYIAESSYTFQDDIDAANGLLDSIFERAPRAVGHSHYIDGNHERRIERWCLEQAQRGATDAAYLLKSHGSKSNLHLDARKVAHYSQGKTYGGADIAATIKLGACWFLHGFSSAQNASAVVLRAIGDNCVFGHVHRTQQSSQWTTRGNCHAFCVGALCERVRLWHHDRPSQWSTGYGLQLVDGSRAHAGEFLHVNVPIIDGVSRLGPLIRRLSR